MPVGGSLRWAAAERRTASATAPARPGRTGRPLDRLMRHNGAEGAAARVHRREQVPLLLRPTATLRDVAGMTDLKWRLGNLLSEGRARTSGGILLIGRPASACRSWPRRPPDSTSLDHRRGDGAPDPARAAGPAGGRGRARRAGGLRARRDGRSRRARARGRRLAVRSGPHARRPRRAAQARVADGLEQLPAGVAVIGTSTSPWRIDASLRRAGRFARMLFVPPPDLLARSRILADRLSYLPIAADVNAASIAAVTEASRRRSCRSSAPGPRSNAMGVSRHVGNVWAITQRDWRAPSTPCGHLAELVRPGPSHPARLRPRRRPPLRLRPPPRGGISTDRRAPARLRPPALRNGGGRGRRWLRSSLVPVRAIRGATTVEHDDPR